MVNPGQRGRPKLAAWGRALEGYGDGRAVAFTTIAVVVYSRLVVIPFVGNAGDSERDAARHTERAGLDDARASGACCTGGGAGGTGPLTAD